MRSLIVASLLFPSVALAAAPDQLVRELADKDKASGALEELVAMKEKAVPALTGEALEGHDLTARGWSIVGLSRIGGPEAIKAVDRLKDDAKQPMIARTWAAAARIDMADSFEDALSLASVPSTFPATQRPLSLKISALVAKGNVPSRQLLAACANNYQLQQSLAEAILAGGMDPLLDSMVHDKDQNVRQMAAAYLGTYAQRQGKAGNEIVGNAVAKAYAFDKGAKEVPWTGGPLYVPNIGWDKSFGKKLAGNLVAWMVWADRKGKQEERQQIYNNLYSYSLAEVVGYQQQAWSNNPGTDSVAWLRIWKDVVGREGVRAILAEQGAEDDPRYREVIR